MNCKVNQSQLQHNATLPTCASLLLMFLPALKDLSQLPINCGKVKTEYVSGELPSNACMAIDIPTSVDSKRLTLEYSGQYNLKWNFVLFNLPSNRKQKLAKKEIGSLKFEHRYLLNFRQGSKSIFK